MISPGLEINYMSIHKNIMSVAIVVLIAMPLIPKTLAKRDCDMQYPSSYQLRYDITCAVILDVILHIICHAIPTSLFHMDILRHSEITMNSSLMSSRRSQITNISRLLVLYCSVIVIYNIGRPNRIIQCNP